MKKWIYSLLITALPAVCSAQVTPPALGAASSFALFTAVGAFDNVGPSIVRGDIGTNAGAFSGFPLGVVFGNIHVADTYSTQAATDVQSAFGQLSTIPCVVPLGVLGGTGGNPQVLTPNAYCLGGATTFAGELILDAQGDPNAVFFIRVSGALTTGEGSIVTLINGASLHNVYWQVTGRVDLGHNSVFQGTLVVDGAINLIEGATLLGRGLSRTGAITMDASTVTLPVVTSTAWISSTTGTLASRKDWFLPKNWSNGVPTALLEALILSGRPAYPVLTSGTAISNGLTLGTGASLTQNGGTLEVHGDFRNSGTFTAGGGTVELAGISSQQVGGSSLSKFWNLSVGAAGAALAGTTQVKRVLTLNGDLLTNSRPFTLLSDATNTAMVVNAGGAVTGTTAVQRYLTPTANTGLGYRHLSSPVVSTTLNDLTTTGFAPKVNTAYNVLPTPTLPVVKFPNVFGYDETRGGAGNQNFMDGYFSPSSTESPLVSGMGYSVYIKGGQTPDFVGTLQNGDLVMADLTRTGNGDKSGWHLLGNPYPAPLDWDLVTVPAGMSNAISVFKTTGTNQTGVYLTRVSDGLGNGTGTLTDGLLPMGQGFFAQVTGTGPVSFTFPQAARLTAYANPAHFRAAPETRSMLLLTLRQPTETNPEAQGSTQIYFAPDATTAGADAFDGASPARNIGVPTLLTLTPAAEQLAVNGLPSASLTTGVSIPLVLDLPTAGTYTLAAAQLFNLADKGVMLVDRLSHTRYDLAAQPTVTFTADRAGEDRTRFTLELGRIARGTTALSAEATTLALYPNPTAGQEVRLMLTNANAPQLVELFDATGRMVRTTLTAADGSAIVSVTGLSAGVYTVRAATATQRLLVK